MARHTMARGRPRLSVLVPALTGWLAASLSASAGPAQAGNLDPLLAIDQNRSAVVERIAGEWSAALASSSANVSADQLQAMLMQLRADQLRAAGLAGSLKGLRDVLAVSVVESGPINAALLQSTSLAGASGAARQKSMGDTADDVVYTPVTPCRLVETRGTFAAVYRGDGSPGHVADPFTSGEIRSYTLAGANGVCTTQLQGITPAAVQLQVFGMPVNGASGDIEILPQGAAFGSTATEVYVGSVAFNTVSTTVMVNPANNQISVQVRGGGANLALDVVGYFERPENYFLDQTITGFAASIGGGGANTASEAYAVVGGGASNTASGTYSAIGGGSRNTASNAASTVPGGDSNVASGSFSFAAGHRAHATTNGSFIWADSQEFDFAPSVDNFFGVRATGGIGLTVAINPSTGGVTQFCNLLPGTPGWQCTSDRNAKENLVPVDGAAILERLAAMPVYTWNFKGFDPAVRALSPTAQDFHAAFGLGNDDKSIATLNIEGVALAAIQGLYARERVAEAALVAKDREISALEQALRDRDADAADIRGRLDSIERRVMQ
jgi:Chaperone of endosialidase